MIKFIPLLVLFMLAPACSQFSDWLGVPGSTGPTSTSANPRAQMQAAQASFDQKLESARGESLNQVRRSWGNLEAGLSQDGLTVYKWSQTAQVTIPAGENSAGQTQVASCLAMFIVDQGGVVVDSTSEGRCFDYNKMPAWKPIVTQSTDGRTGSIR